MDASEFRGDARVCRLAVVRRPKAWSEMASEAPGAPEASAAPEAPGPLEPAYRNPFDAHRNVGIPLTDRVFEDERLADEDWAGMVFQSCVFERTTFSSNVMYRTVFVKCRFVDCVVEHCELRATQWVECTGAGLRIAGGELTEVTFSECDFDRLEIEQGGRQVTLASGRVGELEFADAGLAQEILTLSDCDVAALRAERAEWRDCSAVGVDLGRWNIDGASLLRCSFISRLRRRARPVEGDLRRLQLL